MRPVPAAFHVEKWAGLTLKILFAEKASAGSIPAPGTFQRIGSKNSDQFSDQL